MTKEFLYQKLADFITEGHLSKYYSDEQIEIFSFLEAVYVGFVLDDSKQDPIGDVRGALLTENEAQIILRSRSVGILSVLCEKEECSIAFTNELLSECKTKKGCGRIKKSLKPFYFSNGKKQKSNPLPLLSRFPSVIGAIVIKQLHESRQKRLATYKKYIKRVRVLGIILLCALAFQLASFFTMDFRDQFNPKRESVAFDKNGSDETYAQIEIDFLTSFATIFSTSNTKNDFNHLGTYYLWGDLKNEKFGILRFSDLSEEEKLIPEGENSAVFEEPIILYGTGSGLPFEIKQVLSSFEQSDNDPITLPGHTVTTPDGEEISIPGHTITMPAVPDYDYGELSVKQSLHTAKEFFATQGISLNKNSDFGTNYLIASTDFETTKTPINKVIDGLGVAGLFAIGLLFIPFFFSASKADASGEALFETNLIRIIYESVIPVQISGQAIHVFSKQFAEWHKATQAPFECSATISLTEDTPTVFLWEDGDKTREYVLETEKNESFAGKYFQTSVRISVMGDPAVPVAQIDGFISDTPEERNMELSDVGYRMEGHFLECGGEEGAIRYEMNRGQDLTMKALKYQGYTTPSNVRLIGVCPHCKKSFCFHGYAFYRAQNDVAYSDDGLDCCEIRAQNINKETWTHTADGKTFRYYNSFNCPHCGTPYIDYLKFPQNKVFGVSGCVLLGRKPYRDQ